MASKKVKLNSSSMPGVAIQIGHYVYYVSNQPALKHWEIHKIQLLYETHSSAYETLKENLKALEDLDSSSLSINISGWMMVLALEQLSDPTMRNGIKHVMPCVTRKILIGYVKENPSNKL